MGDLSRIGGDPTKNTMNTRKNGEESQEEHSNHKDTITHVLDPHTHKRRNKIQSATKERYMGKVHPNP